jgi:uncharacterized membrane protein
MSEPNSNSLHKEFELERMILFSDAVFAIAITLLIIEVKFPELPEHKDVLSVDLFKLFKPTILQFFAFLISFFFIGISWSRHLKMFRFLKAYDNKVIFLNLLSLLFIVTFPFSASAAIHITHGFIFPMIIYLGNIMLVMVSNFLLAHYILKQQSQLSIPGHEAEKNYIYLQSKYPAILLPVVFVIVIATYIITNQNFEYTVYSIYSVIIGMVIMRRKLKRHKPKKQAEF